MAKLGIALGSGPRGLGFESRHSDHRKEYRKRLFCGTFFFIYGYFLNFSANFDFDYFSVKSQKVNKKVNNGRFFRQKPAFKRRRKTAQRLPDGFPERRNSHCADCTI